MNIADMKWTDNNLCLVVGFSSSYFFIFSRLGHIINIIPYFNEIESFCSVKIDNIINVSLYGNTLYFKDDITLVTTQLCDFPNEFTFVELDNPFGKSNSLLNSIAIKPQSSNKAKIICLLSSLLENENINFYPNKIELESSPQNDQNIRKKSCSFIRFVNPFPQLPDIDGSEVMESSMKFIEPLMWKGDYDNCILECIMEAFEKVFKNILMCKFVL